MSGEVVVRIDIAKYKFVDLDAGTALKLLEALREAVSRDPSDVREVIRYIRNFDEFYEYMRRKFKDYIAPPHRPDDYIKGNVFVDKIKLYRGEHGEKRVVIVFDRRVKTSLIEEALRKLGFTVRVERSL